jgi:hypothetical protein
MPSHGTPSPDVVAPGWYRQFIADVITQLPGPEELSPEAANHWHQNRGELRVILRRDLCISETDLPTSTFFLEEGRAIRQFRLVQLERAHDLNDVAASIRRFEPKGLLLANEDSLRAFAKKFPLVKTTRPIGAWARAGHVPEGVYLAQGSDAWEVKGLFGRGLTYQGFGGNWLWLAQTSWFPTTHHP